MHVESLWEERQRVQENAKHCHYKIPGQMDSGTLAVTGLSLKGDSLG